MSVLRVSTHVGYDVDKRVRDGVGQHFRCGLVEARGYSVDPVPITEETHVAQQVHGDIRVLRTRDKNTVNNT